MVRRHKATSDLGLAPELHECQAGGGHGGAGSWLWQKRMQRGSVDFAEVGRTSRSPRRNAGQRNPGGPVLSPSPTSRPASTPKGKGLAEGSTSVAQPSSSSAGASDLAGLSAIEEASSMKSSRPHRCGAVRHRKEPLTPKRTVSFRPTAAKPTRLSRGVSSEESLGPTKNSSFPGKGFLSRRTTSIGGGLNSADSLILEIAEDDLQDAERNNLLNNHAEIRTLTPYVIKLQRAYRMMRFVYKRFGPVLFVDSHGQSRHGQIKFRSKLNLAQWIRVTPTASARRLVKLMDHHWGLPKPEVLITVTGGAQDFTLTPDLFAAFRRGLVSVAMSAKAWIFTAGSDAGVMKLVGNAVAALAKDDVRLPLIGVFPWGVTNGRQILQSHSGRVARYPDAGLEATRDGAPLNATHTHFILVDDGTEGGAAWGSEIGLRNALEETCAQLKRVPVVQLVVQGGPGTLRTVEGAAASGTPIIILADSGGAANAIYEFCSLGIEEVEERFKPMEQSLAKIKQMNEAFKGNLLTFFSLRDDAARLSAKPPELREALLRGIIHTMNTSPYAELLPSLRLTVLWDEPELAREILTSTHVGAATDGKEADNSAVGETLQLALEMHRSRIVRVLIALPGFTVAPINVGRLYLQRDQLGFLSENRPLQSRLHAVQREISDPACAEMHHALYQKALARFFYSIDPMLLRVLRRKDSPQPHDIFFWLVCQGQEDMARTIWPRCFKPVHCALLGAAIAHRMSRDLSPPASEAAGQFSMRMQEWAHGALEMADERQAYKILRLDLQGGTNESARLNTLMDIAMATDAKHFLTQRHCVSLMSQQWRGGIEGSSITIRKDFSYLLLLFRMFVPPANSYLFASGPLGAEAGKQSSKDDPHERPTESMVEALGLVFRIVGEERGKVIKEHALSQVTSKGFGPSAEHDEWVAQLFGPVSNVMAQDEVLKSRFASFYEAPVVRFMFRAIIHTITCTTYVLLILFFIDPITLDEREQDCINKWPSPNTTEEVFFRRCLAQALPNLVQLSDDGGITGRGLTSSVATAFETIWMLLEVGISLDLKHQSIVRNHLRLRPKRGTGRLSYFSDVLLLVALVLRGLMSQIAANLYSKDYNGSINQTTVDRDQSLGMYTWYQRLVSLKTVLIFTQTLTYFSVYRPLGVLVIIITEMLNDIVRWGLLFGTLMVAFSLCFMGLQSAGSFKSTVDGGEYKAFSYDGAAWAPFWAVYGEFDPSQYDGFASSLMWSYLFISAIILVNLLVAMFSDTYGRVQAFAEQEYVYQDYDRITEHRHVMLPAPPLINAPYILSFFVRNVCEWVATYFCCFCCSYSCTHSGKSEAASDAATAAAPSDPSHHVPRIPMTKPPSQRSSPETERGGGKGRSSPSAGRNLDVGKNLGSCRRFSLFGSSDRGILRPRAVSVAGPVADSTPSAVVPEVSMVDSEDVDYLAFDPDTLVFDGHTQAEEYLKLREKQCGETLEAMTRSLTDAVASNQRDGFNEFYEVKTRLGKVEAWLDEETENRETKTDPARQEQAQRLERVEMLLTQIMTHMGVRSQSTGASFEVPKQALSMPPQSEHTRRKRASAPSPADLPPPEEVAALRPSASPPADLPPTEEGAALQPTRAAARARRKPGLRHHRKISSKLQTDVGSLEPAAASLAASMPGCDESTIPDASGIKSDGDVPHAQQRVKARRPHRQTLH